MTESEGKVTTQAAQKQSAAATQTGGMRAITVARLYGSGGGEVARRVAKRLGWRLIDHEVIVQVAFDLHITEEEVEDLDEHTEGFILRALNSMSLMYPSMVENVPPSPSPATRERLYQNALHRVIELAVEEGKSVIVGRGAGALLEGRRDVLRAFVIAPLEQRVAYVARREGLDEANARKRIALKDNGRRRYVQSQYHLQPDDPERYDLTINTAILSLDAAAELICHTLAYKGERLAAPESELGPVSGMGLYPGEAEDVPAPEQAPDAEQPPPSQSVEA
ncbi:MAG TPA: cytidylate kinase-like family protein [Ktedonobacterales bacterium]|nr:cytidylate kinase-like family protein [Ktedonobacterales bacterium]